MSPSLFNRPLMMAVLLLKSIGQSPTMFADDIVADPLGDGENLAVVLTPDRFHEKLRLSNNADPDPQKHLQHLLKVRIRDIQDQCALSQEQRDKLELAGKGDIARIVADIGKLQGRYMGRSFTVEELAAIQPEVYRHGTIPLTHPFTEGSLFQKVLAKTLNTKQMAQFAAWDRTQRRLEILGLLKASPPVYAICTATGNPDIAELIMKKYPHWRPVASHSQNVVLMIVNELQNDIRPLVDDTQWEQLKKYTALAPRIEPRVRAMGHWPIESVQNTEDR